MADYSKTRIPMIKAILGDKIADLENTGRFYYIHLKPGSYLDGRMIHDLAKAMLWTVQIYSDSGHLVIHLAERLK